MFWEKEQGGSELFPSLCLSEELFHGSALYLNTQVRAICHSL